MSNKDIQYSPHKDGGDYPFPVVDVLLPYSECYNGNILIKKAFAKTELTAEHIAEIVKCRKDPIYFIEKYCRITSLNEGIVPFKLFDFQREMIMTFTDHRFVLSMCARQNGKSQCVAAYLTWFAIFNDNKTIAVLANKGDAAQEIMDRIRSMIEYLPFFLQPGVKTYNKRSIEVDTGSKIFSAATSASGIRGRSVDVAYIDEACFIEKDMEFYTSTYPVLSSGKKTRMIMTSTPRGARGMFYMLWREAQENKNAYKTIEADWSARPDRDEEWKMTTISNIGYSRFRQEFENAWIGSSGTLIPTAILEKMQWINPINEDESMKVYVPYIPGNRYLAIADPAGGLGLDYSVCTVLDVTAYPYRIVAKYRNNNISPLLFPHTIMNIGMEYGYCPALVESNNDVGGQVTYILYYELEYENMILTSNSERAIGGLREGGKGNQALPGVRTTKKVKSIGCSNLKTLLENEYLVIEDQETIEELGTFIAKNSSYEADEECHDDTVMPLVLFSWFIKSELFNEYCGSDIGVDLYQRNVDRAMESVMPFGYIQVAVHEVSEYRGNVGGHSMNVTEDNTMSFERWMNE